MRTHTPRARRTTSEPRVELANGCLRLDFDPRTSDTFYNYVHIRCPRTGRWQRVYNFGVDVRAPRSDNPAQELNLIGLAMDVRRENDLRARVTYPDPLIQVRQFDPKVGTPANIERYPDFTRAELPGLIHARGEIEFVYQIDPGKPSYTVRGRRLAGQVRQVAYIVNGLWVDDQPMPTHEFIEGFPEFDIASPEDRICREVEIANVAYAIFYRHDGRGLPFALLPLTPVRADMINFYDNWQCPRDFGPMGENQAWVPTNPPITGCNDIAYQPLVEADGTIPGIRVAFFPDFADGRGGTGLELRRRLVEAIRQEWSNEPMWWAAPNRPWPTIKMMSPLPEKTIHA